MKHIRIMIVDSGWVKAVESARIDRTIQVVERTYELQPTSAERPFPWSIDTDKVLMTKNVSLTGSQLMSGNKNEFESLVAVAYKELFEKYPNAI